MSSIRFYSNGFVNKVYASFQIILLKNAPIKKYVPQQ